ncbi:MAG: L-glutamate gamma-semialdehyde dehydrogenase [Deltaproteobacteria bacterium]|nr:L-glutamate gamma-semialdehyde dehydrogenase [Deltaproteobacteria bacterium]
MGVALSDKIEQQTRAIGREIFARLTTESPSVFHLAWWDEKILDWCMRDETLKVQMFRFIDVLPMLKTGAQVARHLQEYFLDHKEIFPIAVQWGLNFASYRSAAARAVALAVRRNATRMAQRFITGATPAEALAAIRKLRRQHLAFTLDLLGEATLSEEEAAAYQQRYLDLLTSLATAAKSWEPVTLIDTDHAGPIPRVNISLKLTALYSQFDALDPEHSAARVKERLRPLLRTAQAVGAFVTVDMEQYRYKELTLRVYKEILEEDEFRAWPHVGMVLQAYLRETEQDLRDLLAWVKTRGTPIGVRLVRGAYWDYETVIARQRHWPVPVFTRKWETDINFERLAILLLEHHELVRPAIATHNIRSIAYALAASQCLGLPERAIEFQMLYGMGDAIKATLVQLGQRLRVYAPFGELIPGMGYLVRRLLENTSNDSFLRQSFIEHTAVDDLLRSPFDPSTSLRTGSAQDRPEEERLNGSGVSANAQSTANGAFHNEPELDFAQEEHRQRFREALDQVPQQLGRTYPLVINGEEITTGAEIVSRNPSHPDQVVGRAARAGVAEAEHGVTTAVQALPAWRATPAAERADFLFRAAAVMRARRAELAAWEVVEAGKPWREADADVCEAIDYLVYYGREMLRIAPARQLDDLPGEVNLYVYQPRGVAVVIAPWNFPLAILTGMTAAALVAGNTTIMKPAEQTPVIAAKLMEIFRSVGLPAGVLTYLPGLGEEVGEYLVTHPRVNLIAFTGSLTVGLRINALAAQTTEGQHGIKKVIAEMGGKNAIIVDDDADLDEAVLGVVTSAFGYAGQKCSACSRAIVLEQVYDLFLKRLVEATRSLRMGPAEEPGTFVPPLIDDEARQKVQRYIAIGKREGRVVLEIAGPAEGYFVGPIIVTGVSPQAVIAQEEIFGPVLAVLKARDFDEALEMALGTPYALTGGLYSRSPAHIARARQEFRVGNLYLNRKITGALVGRQPFGGLGLSGIGSKAGGPDYLFQFMEPRVMTENTLRRGFAPKSNGGNGSS